MVRFQPMLAIVPLEHIQQSFLAICSAVVKCMIGQVRMVLLGASQRNEQMLELIFDCDGYIAGAIDRLCT